MEEVIRLGCIFAHNKNGKKSGGSIKRHDHMKAHNSNESL